MIKTSKKLNKMSDKLCDAKYPVNSVFDDNLFVLFKQEHSVKVSSIKNGIEEGFKLCEKTLKAQKSIYFIKPTTSIHYDGGAYFIGEEQELLKLMEKYLEDKQDFIIEQKRTFLEKEIKYHQKQVKALQKQLDKIV